MKKWIYLMCLTMLCGVVQGQDPNVVMPDEYATVRLLTEPEFQDGVAKAELWLGFGRGESEVGAIVAYESFEEEDGEESKFAIGAFTMYHLPDLRPMLEGLLWPAETLPEQVMAKPAIGISGVFDLDSNGLKISPVVELVIYKAIAIQTRYNIFSGDVDAEEGWQIGISTIWEF